MKKILALAMTLAMIVSMCAVVAVAAPEDKGVVTLSSTITPVKVGETLTVKVALSTTGEIGGMVLDVLYDSAVLEFIAKDDETEYFNATAFETVDGKPKMYGYQDLLATHIPDGDETHDQPYVRFTIFEKTTKPVNRFGGEGSKLGNSVDNFVTMQFKVKGDLKEDSIKLFPDPANLVGGDKAIEFGESKVTINLPVNFEALDAAIKAAEAKIAEFPADDFDYNNDIVAKLDAAKALDRKTAKQADIDAAAKALQAEVDAFEATAKKADKTALVAEIEKAEKIDLTAEGIKADKVEAFKAALDAAKAMNEKEDAKQSEVNAAAAALKDAAAALVDTADVNIVVLSILAVVALAGAALIIAKRRHA